MIAALPALRPACRASVTIPARNEAERIGSALVALLAQRRLDGGVLDPATYEIIVFCNGCTDGTADVVREIARAHPQHTMHLMEAAADDPDARSIGRVRGAVMHAAASRFLRAGMPDGAVLATDADSAVAPDWIVQNLVALRSADAVGGRIVAFADERARLDARVRALVDRWTVYEFALARVDSLAQPSAHDPWPRHAQHFGASFAVRADAYMRAGGIPDVDRLEDLAFYEALLQSGARVRHSLKARVATAPRLTPRVAGGYGTLLHDFAQHAAAGTPMLVAHPHDANVTVPLETAIAVLNDQARALRSIAASPTRSTARSGAG
jgi:glycosyltransferase involved in cell wall biosynthesis